MVTGKDVRARRRALGYGQKDLAFELGIRQPTISQWENGARPVPEWVDGELRALEDAQDDLVDQIVSGEHEGTVDEDDLLERVALVRAQRVLRRRE